VEAGAEGVIARSTAATVRDDRSPTRSEARRRGGNPALRPARFALSARKPPHPGQFLETRFLRPLHLSQSELARALGISRRRVNEFINGRRAITPDTAVRLAVYFGNDAAFWMHLQVAWDMHGAVHDLVAPRPRRRAA
jgi:addiction module HigA family antidote